MVVVDEANLGLRHEFSMETTKFKTTQKKRFERGEEKSKARKLMVQEVRLCKIFYFAGAFFLLLVLFGFQLVARATGNEQRLTNGLNGSIESGS